MQVIFHSPYMCCGMHVTYSTIHKGNFKKVLLLLLKEYFSQNRVLIEISVSEKLLR